MMASDDFKIFSNKENAELEGDDGIEANDLATLLSRFEEATSSDDINLPQATHKTKWNIMKAKSAGNSPGVTPPATPPPMLNGMGPLRLTSFTKARPVINRNQTIPIKLTVVNPMSVSTLPVSLPARYATNSLLPAQPKINIQLSNTRLPSPALRVMKAGVRNVSKSTTSSPVSPHTAQNPAQIPTEAGKYKGSRCPISNYSDPSGLPRDVIKLPFNSNLSQNCVQTSSNPSNVSGDTVSNQTFNVLRMPALDAASSGGFSSFTDKQIIPKKRASALPNAIEVIKKKKLGNSPSPNPVFQSPLSISASTVKQGPVMNFTANQTMPLVTNEKSVKADCLQNLSTKPAENKKPGQSQGEATVQRDEHTYCWSGPCFNNKGSRIGISTGSDDSGKASMCGDISDKLGSSGSSHFSEESVLEEGEVYVDANGNDIFSRESPSGGRQQSDRLVCFDTGDKSINRRGRKYRRRGELSGSPVREDNSDFFDKIPSYYTALSIPAKQIRKTVFESVSSTVGSQDHLAMHSDLEVREEESGQYNKVPAHHSIFTNTSQEFEFDVDHEPSCSFVDEDKTQHGKSSRVRRISSASRHSGHSTSSHRSARSGSRRSFGRDRSSLSRSPSPSGSEYSQQDQRRSRPLVRRRRNSSSNLSVSSMSSSGSSNSYCSTCGASLSRSRSRSYSSDRSRERSYSRGSHDSRSRSRSPRERSRKTRARYSRSPSPEYRSSRWRSDSRSRSPRRQRRNSFRNSSRSRRHQMKERSSAERRLMEQRKEREEEKVKAMEERRVLYVGKVPDNYTKHQLRKRFECFGEIKNVRLNFRVHGDNYGFVTFLYACDAFAAKEKGNSIQGQPKFDLCFGGRRRFCPDKYADLDGNREIEEEYAPLPSKVSGEMDYAALLKQHVNQQKKMKR